jgi:hypothetical protein
VLQKPATIQNNLDNNLFVQVFGFFLYIFKNLESCLLVFGNWFGITEMATDRKVESTKNVPKPPKSFKGAQQTEKIFM